MKLLQLVLVASCIYLPTIYPKTETVTNNNDGGAGSLREAMTNVNAGNDGSNTINMQIPGNSPISSGSDLPVIKKNTVINSIGKQPIDGKGKYRLFATIMADLTINNCTLQNGAAIGGDSYYRRGAGGGLGAGGAVYIDRGNTLTLVASNLQNCKAEGGEGGDRLDGSNGGGGGC